MNKHVMVCTHCGSECPFRNISTADRKVTLCWDCSADEALMRRYGFDVGLPAPAPMDGRPTWLQRADYVHKDYTRR